MQLTGRTSRIALELAVVPISGHKNILPSWVARKKKMDFRAIGDLLRSFLANIWPCTDPFAPPAQ